MNEINLAATLAAKRRERCLTQEDVANHLGVSKASVSKWETNQSYPDITLLPKLAAYFDITIDELISYQPQLSREEIQQHHQRLAQAIMKRPFDEVLTEVQELIKAYHCCYPLLLQMAVFYVNHQMLAPTREQQLAMLEEAAELCRFIQAKCNDMELLDIARSTEAICYQILGQPEKIIELFNDALTVLPMSTTIRAQAHQQLGQPEKAQALLQVDMYQHLLLLLDECNQLMLLYANDAARLADIIQRAQVLIETFQLRKLQPNSALSFHYSAAYVYCGLNQLDAALMHLEHYVDIAVNDFFPFKLHGDEFFDQIDEWLSQLATGNEAPRSEETIKESLLSVVVNEPAFAPLRGDKRYHNLLQKLTFHLKG